MKKLIFSFLAIVMVVGFSNKVMAQTQAMATQDALATIIAPITIVEDVQMSFGDIIKGAGTVQVTTEGVRNFSNSTMLAGLQLGTITAATFNVTGETGYTYQITLPLNDIVTLTLTDADPMPVNAFVSVPSATSTLTSGNNLIKVGATLTVAADQDPGDYAGVFNVIVAYN